MKQRHGRSIFAIAAVPIVLATLLVGCGSDGDDNASTEIDRETTTTLAEETATTLDEGTTDTTEATSETTIAETGTTLPGGSPSTTAGPSGSGRSTTTVRRSTTTVKGSTATTAKPTATTIDEGPPKNITGMEVAPGAPIKIGALVAGGAEAITGDLGQAYEIAFDILRKKGELPVHGRDVVVMTRKYNAVDTANVAAALRAACTALVQDDKIFAGVTWAGPADCLAENKVPAIGSSMPAETMERVWPYGFSLQWDTNYDMQNVPRWADSLNLLKGRKLGMYHGIDAGRQQRINDYFKPELKKLGYSLAEDLGGADEAADRVAVQRFKAAGVDTIFLSAVRPGEFGRAAQAQGYKPKYMLSPADNSGTVLCDGCPARATLSPELFDGSYALAWRRTGENGLTGNPPPAQAGVECAENFERFSGSRTRQNGNASEQQKWQAIQWTCDGARAIVTALRAAGPKLTQGALINALETSIKGQESGLHFDYTWTRTSHFSQSAVKTIQLEGACLCWRTRSATRAPYVR